LLAGVIGVIWNDYYVTMTRCGDKSTPPELIILLNFAQLILLCPEGRMMTFQTHSKWLVAEWDKMVQWRECEYEGLQRSDVLDEWVRIMDHVENGGKKVQLCEGTGEEIPVFKEAAMMYVQEMVSHLEEALKLPVDAYTPPVPPWS
jgi:hypothetical protein